ncbi:DNA topoisomerase IB [Altererythrobacter sp. KTW20L]|uniref:DNA topoisomerase IB n=1 Tax=Altererythrobacter sp. KTW20L TaxID=2942210 RepID=UPI0020BE2797|nr:DNA topoisomerase IB [Altererythrobacter sp. KTW20L]MCL6250806.1 DNA topoisomerase IB [Altererythrobacter sp. KTW20L]
MPPGLVQVDDDVPGITRRRVGRGWAYYRADGERITDRDEIDRLNAVALPPAYVEAWFCPSPDGHILARGLDARGRRQYRYHPDFRAESEARKFALCGSFGAALPKLRRQVVEDLAKRGLAHDTVTAAAVRLLDRAAIRVGNECYAKANRSYGATTLRQRHAEVSGKALRIAFKAKSGKDKEVEVTDASLARLVRRLGDLPGQHLFQYIDGDQRCPVTSSDVNRYIQAAMGEEFTAKHFRTWAGSVKAFELLASAKADLRLNAMAEEVAEFLGNTPTIAKASYIHPAVLGLARGAQDGSQAEWRAGLKLPRRTKYLDRHERGLIAFLAAEERKPAS